MKLCVLQKWRSLCSCGIQFWIQNFKHSSVWRFHLIRDLELYWILEVQFKRCWFQFFIGLMRKKTLHTLYPHYSWTEWQARKCTHQWWDRFGSKPNRTEPNRTESGSVRNFRKIGRFDSVRFKTFSVRFGSVRSLLNRFIYFQPIDFFCWLEKWNKENIDPSSASNRNTASMLKTDVANNNNMYIDMNVS
jgi:hypothetical protein